jgi:hypothetical protein
MEPPERRPISYPFSTTQLPALPQEEVPPPFIPPVPEKRAAPIAVSTPAIIGGPIRDKKPLRVSTVVAVVIAFLLLIFIVLYFWGQHLDQERGNQRASVGLEGQP